MALDINSIISGIAVFQMLLLTIVLLSHPKGKKISNRILSVFMLVNAVLIFTYQLMTLEILVFYSHYYSLIFLCLLNYLAIPLLYFYIRSLCYSDFKFVKMDLLHLVPYLFTCGFLSFHCYYGYWNPQSVPFFSGLWSTITERYAIYHLGLYPIYFVYIFPCLSILNRYKKRARQTYSSLEKVDISWIYFILCSLYLTVFIEELPCTLKLFNYSNPDLHSKLTTLSTVCHCLFSTLVVYKGLTQPESLTGLILKTKDSLYSKDNHPEDKPSEDIRIDTEKLEELKILMRQEKPYLKPAMTIDDLSARVSYSARTLSNLINTALNQNFFDFINSYRIKEAMIMLKDPVNKKTTVLEILYEVGFNSKSSFHTSFKKQTSMTPTQYRRQQL